MGTQRLLHRHSGEVASREPFPPSLGVKPHPSCPSLWQRQPGRTRWAVAEEGEPGERPSHLRASDLVWGTQCSAGKLQPVCRALSRGQGHQRDSGQNSHPGLGVPLYKLGRTLGFTEAPLPTR